MAVILLQGRYAGKKAGSVKSFDYGSSGRAYGHRLVAGLKKHPSKVIRKYSAKKSRVQCLIKLVNYQHLMPTRYTLGVDLKEVATLDSHKKVAALKEAKGKLEERFKTGKKRWLFTKLSDEFMMAESALHEMKKDHQTKIRNQVTAIATELIKDIEVSRFAIAQAEMYGETRKEVERKLDLQYQQQIAEALDIHLSVRRRERAHLEEQIRQEKARLEAEMLAKTRAEKEKKEVERKAAKAVAEKEEADRKAAEQKLTEEIEKLSVAGSSATSNAQAGGKTIQAAEMTLEKHRLKKLEELEALNKAVKSQLNKDFSSFEKRIGRVIRQISGVTDNISAKINEIVKIFKDPSCPISISIATFANKMVSSKQNPFALSYVIVYVTSQFPQAMDILLAEFHKACIYTVPKHVVNSQSAWDSEAYERLGSIMRLYGALVQTEILGGNATNIHGIEHGWAWLARFLNTISANNRATATALNAFLQTAGFGLHQRYKFQFVKVVNVVREHFLQKLRAKTDTSDLQLMIGEITAYLDDETYLKEPEDRIMKAASLLSKERLLLI